MHIKNSIWTKGCMIKARSPSREGEDLKLPKQLIFVYEISQGNKGDTDLPRVQVGPCSVVGGSMGWCSGRRGREDEGCRQGRRVA